MKRRLRENRNILRIIVIIILFGVCTGVIINLNLNKRYINEEINMTEKESEIIDKIIELAKEKVGFEYVWGGKGEIMTEERLNELIGYYGEDYYPLKTEKYIGKQAFDCSGLTYWLYNELTDINIGYSTTDQEEILENYSVDKSELQKGDLIFTPGHVVLYIGKGRVINANNKYSYPIGGVKEQRLYLSKKSRVYRPIDYINEKL